MSRLLFAAARGAHIEDYILRKWTSSEYVYITEGRYAHRIHPNDQHLQYGPISTALRELAEKGKEPYTLVGLMALKAFEYEWEYPAANEDECAHAQMLALILAEALADEGL